MFSKYIAAGNKICESGCGGGFLLNEFNNPKIGVEINSYAIKCCKEMGLEIVNNIEAIPNDSLDVVYSTMALEHVENPYGILKSLHAKLRQDGKLIIHVPAEDSSSEYVVNDENNHLYTWNQLTLGNLVKSAGYFVDETRLIEAEWPIHYSELYDQLGEDTFSVLEYIYGRIRNHKSVIVVGIKKQ